MSDYENLLNLLSKIAKNNQIDPKVLQIKVLNNPHTIFSDDEDRKVHYDTPDAHLRQLNIKKCNLKKIPALNFSSFKKLDNLLIEENPIKELDSDCLKGLNILYSLNLSTLKIQELPETIFSDLKSLEILHINSSHFKKILPEVFRPLKNLRSLSLNNSKYLQFEGNMFSYLVKLRSLDLCNSNMKIITNNLFKGLNKLRELYLTNNQLKKIPISMFNHLPSLNYIELNVNRFIMGYKPQKNMNNLPNVIRDCYQNKKQVRELIDTIKQLNEIPIGDINKKDFYIQNGLWNENDFNSISKIFCSKLKNICSTAGLLYEGVIFYSQKRIIGLDFRRKALFKEFESNKEKIIIHLSSLFQKVFEMAYIEFDHGQDGSHLDYESKQQIDRLGIFRSKKIMFILFTIPMSNFSSTACSIILKLKKKLSSEETLEFFNTMKEKILDDIPGGGYDSLLYHLNFNKNEYDTSHPLIFSDFFNPYLTASYSNIEDYENNPTKSFSNSAFENQRVTDIFSSLVDINKCCNIDINTNYLELFLFYAKNHPLGLSLSRCSIKEIDNGIMRTDVFHNAIKFRWKKPELSDKTFSVFHFFPIFTDISILHSLVKILNNFTLESRDFDDIEWNRIKEIFIGYLRLLTPQPRFKKILNQLTKTNRSFISENDDFTGFDMDFFSEEETRRSDIVLVIESFCCLFLDNERITNTIQENMEEFIYNLLEFIEYYDPESREEVYENFARIVDLDYINTSTFLLAINKKLITFLENINDYQNVDVFQIIENNLPIQEKWSITNKDLMDKFLSELHELKKKSEQLIRIYIKDRAVPIIFIPFPQIGTEWNKILKTLKMDKKLNTDFKVRLFSNYIYLYPICIHCGGKLTETPIIYKKKGSVSRMFSRILNFSFELVDLLAGLGTLSDVKQAIFTKKTVKVNEVIEFFKGIKTKDRETMIKHIHKNFQEIEMMHKGGVSDRYHITHINSLFVSKDRTLLKRICESCGGFFCKICSQDNCFK